MTNTAPYNFVPLNNQIIEEQEKPNSYNTYHENKLSGYIDLDIEAKTPVYIRGTRNGTETRVSPEFFSPGGITKIPGSSLRGMIRTLIEITSFGCFGFHNNDTFLFRTFADKNKTLRDNYLDKATDKTKPIKQKKGEPRYPKKSLAGYLKKEAKKYYIYPTTYIERVRKENDNLSAKQRNWEKCLYEFEDFLDPQTRKDFCRVVTGYMNKKKTDYLLHKFDSEAQKIEISKKDLDIYKEDRLIVSKINDINKTSNLIDILEEKIKKGIEEIPCFYVQEDIETDGNVERRVSFGHTPFFRFQYKNSINNKIPSNLLDEDYIDIAKAIFGIENSSKKENSSFATRVFFEDALMTSGSIETEVKIPKILASPKATNIQNYLEQQIDNKDYENKSFSHYDSNGIIRGNKLYWHQDKPQWEESNTTNITQHSSQYTKIKPVSEGSKFKGRIRFENLSEIELGALLFNLKLDENCCHKIGMGKPLGLGSIKITPTLFVSDKKIRYSSLFSNDIEKKNLDNFIKNFDKYVCDFVNATQKNEVKTIWEIYRITQLKEMLIYREGQNNSVFKYLPLEEFKNRELLLPPTKYLR